MSYNNLQRPCSVIIFPIPNFIWLLQSDLIAAIIKSNRFDYTDYQS